MGEGVTFRFYAERDDPSRLHVAARHAVDVTTAIETFFEGRSNTTWIPERNCYESDSQTHRLVWLWLDDLHSHVLVITCMSLTK